MAERDAKGRFVKGNREGAKGGHARAARLTREQIAAFGRMGIQAIADRRFGGDFEAAQRWMEARRWGKAEGGVNDAEAADG